MPLLETEANQMKQGERSRGFTPEIERCLTMKRNKELNCPNDSEMFAYFEGTLSALHRRSVEKHLAGCDSCRESLAWLIQSAAEVAEGEPDEPSVEEVRTQVARLVAFAGQDAGAAAPPIHGQSRRKGYRASDHQGTTLFGLQISPRLILAAAALILMAAALPIIYLTLSGQSLDKQSTQGRLALEEAVKSGRRVETRISGLDYSHYGVTAGEENSDDLLFNRALSKLSFAEQPSAPSEARRALAETYLARARGTDNDKALSILQDLAKSGKDSAQVLNDTGVALFENHQYAEAIDAFNRALYKQPGLLEALFNRALTEETSGKTAAAAKDWGEFVATSPEKDWKQEASSHLHRIESLPLQ